MTVSVVIPCHNVEAYIGPCLRSVLTQTHPPVEVIVVDDGSTDSTKTIVQAMQTPAGVPIMLLSQPKRGAGAARNAGLDRCTGRYVQFLDADDLLLPEKLATQLALAESQGGPDLVVGDYENVLPDRRVERIHAAYERPWSGLIATRLGTTSANLWRRDVLLELGGWDAELASSQDYELMFRLLRSGASLAFDRSALTRVLKRQHGSISRTATMDNWLRYITLRTAIRQTLKHLDANRYAAEIAEADQYLFMAIHLLARQDLKKAVDLYRQLLPHGFVPQPGPAITRRYVMTHRLLGFPRAAKLGALLGR